MHKIIIKGLKADCIVGVKPEERLKPQQILVDLKLSLDLSKASVSDAIEDTVDYETLSMDVIEFIEKSQFKLIEKLAFETAKLVKEKYAVEEVKLLIQKPAAVKDARYAGVEITLN